MKFAPLLCGAAIAANFWTAARIPSFYPPISGMRLGEEDAVLSATLLSLGMRRLAADVAFVRMVIYYGTPESRAEELPETYENGGGAYVEMKSRALGIVEMDPYFVYPVLYAAGALAFNLDRPEEALALLRTALRYQPKQWKYLSYIAAIGFKKHGDPERARRELLPILRESDCPTMLKNLIAFMDVRLEHRQEAIQIYRDILASRDKNYYHVARQALQRLGASPD